MIEMTEKYTAYLAMLATRDQALMMLGALALLVVLAWELIGSLVPDPWGSRLRRVYLVGGMLLYLGTLIVVFQLKGSPQ